MKPQHLLTAAVLLCIGFAIGFSVKKCPENDLRIKWPRKPYPSLSLSNESGSITSITPTRVVESNTSEMFVVHNLMELASRNTSSQPYVVYYVYTVGNGPLIYGVSTIVTDRVISNLADIDDVVEKLKSSRGASQITPINIQKLPP